MKEGLITVREVASLLKLSEKEVIDLSRAGEIPHYTIGGEFLRFRKEEILKIKPGLQKKFNLAEENYSWRDRFSDFVYFNDFYIISFLVAAGLVWIIITS